MYHLQRVQEDEDAILPARDAEIRKRACIWCKEKEEKPSQRTS
jgi:hypothetical protein